MQRLLSRKRREISKTNKARYDRIWDEEEKKKAELERRRIANSTPDRKERIRVAAKNTTKK